MISLQSKLPGVGTNIFTTMSKLAEEHNAINLSQGFPDYDCDPQLLDLVGNAMKKGFNQYAPMTGLFQLRNLVAEKTNRLYGSEYNADTEVTITAGGTQAIFTALSAYISAGDEVIIFEPAYDSYAPAVRLLGGLVKPFELVPPDYEIDWEMVKKLFTANTKMIILNSPQNPTGCILTENDIKCLIKLTANTDIIIISDEVYEHIIFDGQKHLSIASYPELRERSFVVASFGKLLHATGWKVGYCLAPEKLMKEFRKVHQYNVFSVNTPMQAGIAGYLANSETYNGLSAFFQQKRDLFRGLLSETKFKLLPCKGSYFQCVSYEHIEDIKDTDMAV
jgi:methionine aminotransferase